jgi:hypothetical protein
LHLEISNQKVRDKKLNRSKTVAVDLKENPRDMMN